MPIRAEPFVQETSRKTGVLLGNTPPRETWEVVPLTEIETVGAVGLAVVVVSAPFGTAGAEGTVVAGVVVVGCTSIEGVVVVPDDAASEPAAGALCVAVAPAAAASAAATSALVTCGRNGSFVWKTSN